MNIQNSCKKCGRVLDKYNRKYPPKSVKYFLNFSDQPAGYILPVLAVDGLILRKEKDDYQILLIKRGKEPNIVRLNLKYHDQGKYAFPGGHVNYMEKTEDACLRELLEETNLRGKNPKLFSVYGKPDRDPRKHVISVVYEVEVDDLSTIKAGDDAAETEFVNVSELIHSPEKFAFDHYNILSDYIKSKTELRSFL